MTEFDHAVVGAGIVGSWTALRLLGLGKKVLLLDQFSEPHTRGSSQGQSRIIRITHADKFITEMMPLAFEMWEEVEEYTKKELIVKTGFLVLDASNESSDDYKKYVKYMKETSPENFLELTATEMVAKYDRKIKYDSLGGVFLDKTGGIMLAHKALLTVQDLYRLRGGTFWDNCQVSEIIPEEEKVKIVTAKGDVVVRSVVVCAGPWTKKLLTPTLIPSLPLQPLLIKVYYWKEKVKGAYSAKSGFPAFLQISEPHIYGLPGIEYPGLLKVCLHGGPAINDPDERDKTPTDNKILNSLKDYIREHLPLLETEPVIVENCMYTMTPDEVFIIDKLPKHKNIIIGAGFSGTGFKTAPVFGRLLSEMAVGVEPFLDVSHYRLSRFDSNENM